MRVQPVGDLKSGAAGGWKSSTVDHRAGQPVFLDRFFSNLWEQNFNIVSTVSLWARLPLPDELPCCGLCPLGVAHP
jgi:hypothetical protein